jgi:hypothetical protein
MSALGHQRTSRHIGTTSALPSKADIVEFEAVVLRRHERVGLKPETACGPAPERVVLQCYSLRQRLSSRISGSSGLAPPPVQITSGGQYRAALSANAIFSQSAQHRLQGVTACKTPRRPAAFARGGLVGAIRARRTSPLRALTAEKNRVRGM